MKPADFPGNHLAQDQGAGPCGRSPEGGDSAQSDRSPGMLPESSCRANGHPGATDETHCSGFPRSRHDENNTAETLAEGAAAILAAGEPAEKVALSRALATRWRAGGMTVGNAIPPPRPARPARPALCPPRDMPRRRNFGSIAGRIALLHALAHIELNAIDLAPGIIARVTGADLPTAFYGDCVRA